MPSPDMRKRHVLMYEGRALSDTGTHGQETAIEFAHCAIDGIINALIRVERSAAAARYAFALADRVVGGIREPTALPSEAKVRRTAADELPDDFHHGLAVRNHHRNDAMTAIQARQRAGRA
jgi:hypothetical protein